MINDKILIQVHTYFRHIFVVRHGLQKNEYSTNMTLSLWKIHLYLWMSFGNQIRTALRITTWKEHAISYFQIFIFTRVNVLKIVCGWIYDNSAIQTHFLSFIKIRMQYPFDRKIPCLMKYASKWNAAARVTYHQHWARIVYPPSISFYYLDFLPVTVTGWQDFAASFTEKCQSAISIAIYKIHASFKINRPIYILNTLNVCITEWPRFYLIWSIFSTHFQFFFTAMVNDWLYLS